MQNDVAHISSRKGAVYGLASRPAKRYLKLNGDVAKRKPAKRDRKATLAGQAIHPDAQHVLEDLMQQEDDSLIEDIANEIEAHGEQIDMNAHEDGDKDSDTEVIVN